MGSKNNLRQVLASILGQVQFSVECKESQVHHGNTPKLFCSQRVNVERKDAEGIGLLESCMATLWEINY